MTTKNLLVELFVEELPPKALQKLGDAFASVLAEHGLSGPVIGIAADGTGFGTDGAVWGCEILAADLTDFERLAHLPYVPLPGGERAVRQPWRMAAARMVSSRSTTKARWAGCKVIEKLIGKAAPHS